MTANGNRVLVGAATALLIPFIEQRWQIKLTDDQSADLVALVVAGFHGLSGLCQWAWTAFQMYFPPPSQRLGANPQQAAQPPGAK